MTQPRSDDTEMDALAAQVRSFPPLPDDEVAGLLGEARTHPGGTAAARLVEHSLAPALAASLARRDQGVELFDLFQEASVATTVAVAEFASRRGEPAGLRHYIERVVEVYLDGVLEHAQLQRASDQKLLEDVEALERVEFELRRELGRKATTLELAARLEWSEEHLEVVSRMLQAAREVYDTEMLEYLDDEEA